MALFGVCRYLAGFAAGIRGTAGKLGRLGEAGHKTDVERLLVDICQISVSAGEFFVNNEVSAVVTDVATGFQVFEDARDHLS